MRPFEEHVSNIFGKKLLTVEVEAYKRKNGKDETIKSSEFGKNVNDSLHISPMLDSLIRKEKVRAKYNLLEFRFICPEVLSRIKFCLV